MNLKLKLMIYLACKKSTDPWYVSKVSCDIKTGCGTLKIFHDFGSVVQYFTNIEKFS